MMRNFISKRLLNRSQFKALFRLGTRALIETLSNYDDDGNENVTNFNYQDNALHLRFIFWYISLPLSEKQQREMTKFYRERELTTANSPFSI